MKEIRVVIIFNNTEAKQYCNSLNTHFSIITSLVYFSCSVQGSDAVWKMRKRGAAGPVTATQCVLEMCTLVFSCL